MEYETNIKRNDKYVPLGSIVIVKGSVKKIVIIGRGIAVRQEGELQYFDYAGCTYPEGLIGDTVLYINHEDLEEIVFEGYQDEDDVRMQKNLKEQVEKLFPDRAK